MNEINTQSSASTLPDEALTELPPLLIPEAVPIPYDDRNTALYGVGLSAINDGLNVFIEAYTGMAIGDELEVHWDASGVAFASQTVTADKQNQTLGLSVPYDRFKPGRYTPFYRLQRISGIVNDSVPRNILVKLDPPGGRDPNPGTPVNENLHAPTVPADVLTAGGVNPERASLGVVVTVPVYPGMAEYDRIDLSWGGQRIVYTVQAGDVKKPVPLTFSKEQILDAGDGDILLMYQIIDAAANRSDGWSLNTEVDVFANGSVLDEPLLLDAVDGVIALKSLNGRPARVQVNVTRANFAKGDTLEVLWAGRDTDNTHVDYRTSREVTLVPTSEIFEIPYLTVAAIAQGRAMVSYTLGQTLVSRRAPVQISGNPVKLVAPTVTEASNGRLSSGSAVATAIVPVYSGMSVGDKVTLVWAGTRQDGTPTDYRSDVSVIKKVQPLSFTIPAAQIAPLGGGLVEVYYQVTSVNSLLPVDSDSLLLQVDQAAVTLPSPALRESVGGAIQLAGLGNQKTVTVDIAPYPGKAAGQTVTLHWSGTLPGGQKGPGFDDKSKLVSTGSVKDAISFLVDVAPYLTPYANGGTLQLYYNVDVVLSGTEHIGVDVAPVGVLAPPVIDEAQGDVINPQGPDILTLRVPPWNGMAAKDNVTCYWQGTPPSGPPVLLTDNVRVPLKWVNKPILFDCEAKDSVRPFDGGRVKVWYQIEPTTGGDTRVSLYNEYRVGQAVLTPRG